MFMEAFNAQLDRWQEQMKLAQEWAALPTSARALLFTPKGAHSKYLGIRPDSALVAGPTKWGIAIVPSTVVVGAQRNCRVIVRPLA